MKPTIFTKDTTLRGYTFGVVEVRGCRVELIDCSWRRLYALDASVKALRCSGRNVLRNWVLLDKCRDSSIDWGDVINNPAWKAGRQEDLINFYRSVGCMARHCWLQGSTPRKGHTGSGGMIDDGCIGCGFVDSLAINTENIGFGISGGRSNQLHRCVAYQDHAGSGAGNVGFAVWNHYRSDLWGGNGGDACAGLWRVDKVRRNDAWMEGADSWTNYTALKSFDIQAQRGLWEQLRKAAI